MKVGDLVQSKYNPDDLGIIKGFPQTALRRSCWVWWIEGGFEMNVWLESIQPFSEKTDKKCP